MAETYGFFDSENHDRPYTSVQMSQYFQGIVTNGVFDGIGKNLIPYVSGIYVKIPSGRAVVDWHWYNNDDTVTLNFPITTGSVRCILVLACDYIQRRIYPQIKQGTSVNLPDVTDTENIKYLKLAYLQVSASTATITKICIGDETPLLKNLTKYVVKEEGKGLSTNDFTNAYKSQIDTNRADISALKSKTDATNVLVGEKANSSDVYTKSETDSRITSKVSEIVAGAPQEFDTLKEMSDWLLNHEESAAAMNTAIAQNTEDVTKLLLSDQEMKTSLSGVIRDVADNQADISTLKENRTEDRTDINSLIVSNQELENTVKKNVQSIADNTGSIETINENVQNNAENIGINTNEISVLKNNVSSLGNGLSATVNRVAVNEADISTLKEERTADRTDITKLLLSDQEMKTSLSGVIQDVADNQADISTLKENRTEDRTDINSLIVSNQELENTVKKNVLSIADNSGNINANKSEIALNRTTLGYQKKNLFKVTISTQVNTGITYTVNSDKSITANGTQSHASATSYLTIGNFTAPFDGEYILTGYPEGDTSVNTSLGYLQYGATVVRNLEHKLTMSKGETISLMLCVKAGSVLENRIFKPMIRSADITDDTYEPYVDDVDTRINESKNDIATNQATLGFQKTKNLLPYTSITVIGLTYTYDNNGYLTSTATNDNRGFIYTHANRSVFLEAGTYIYSTYIKTVPTSSGHHFMKAVDENNNEIFATQLTTNNKVTFTLTESKTVYLIEKINDGSMAAMIRSADITDNTYEPYVKSVKERFDGQSLVYSNTTGGSSPLTITVSNLFADYSAVICNITTSSGKYSLMLPLRYIKSLGTADYYNAEGVLFYYVDDSNITVRTGLGQSNPAINSIKIISLY